MMTTVSVSCGIENSFLGRMRVRDIRKSHILKFYADCKAKGYSNGTIAILQKILHPAFELALDDDVIGKNPSKGCLKDYSDFTEKKQALTLDEEKEFLSRVKESPRMNWLYPMYAICGRIFTGLSNRMKKGKCSCLHCHRIFCATRPVLACQSPA